MKGHWARKKGGCESRPKGKAGTRAKRAMEGAKVVKVHKPKATNKVFLNGKELKNGFNFRYHGFVFQAAGWWLEVGWGHAVGVGVARALALARFEGVHHINFGAPIFCQWR